MVKWNKEQTDQGENSKMINLNLTISIITLSANSLINSSIKMKDYQDEQKSQSQIHSASTKLT